MNRLGLQAAFGVALLVAYVVIVTVTSNPYVALAVVLGLWVVLLAWSRSGGRG